MIKKTISRLMNIPKRINELGMGRYTSSILQSLNIKSAKRMIILNYLQIILNPRIFIRSKLAKKQYPHYKNAYIDKNKKTYIFSANEIKGIDELVSHCLKIYNNKKEDINKSYKPPTYRVIGSINKTKILKSEVDELKPILKFASQPILMSIASNYMGKAPIIFNATLTYTKSMQKGEKPINFQKFHTDMLDKSLLHLVVPIRKISSLNGPFTFVDAPTSKK